MRESYPYSFKCEVCRMTFVIQVTLTYALSAQKANCLNGGNHDYEETFARPRKHAKLRCKNCYDEKPLIVLNEEE